MPPVPRSPLWIAHRGAAALAPENTLEAYRAAWASGLRVLEQDVRMLADGTLVVMHDATVDRTTLGNGAVAEFDVATFRRLRVRPFAGFPSTMSPPLLEDVLEEFRAARSSCRKRKRRGVALHWSMRLRRASIPTTEALVQAFALDDLLPAVAAGYPAMFLTARSDGIQAAHAAGVRWAGLDRRADPSVSTHGARRVSAWSPTRSTIAPNAIACSRSGVCGFFSDDPLATMA